MKPSPARLTAAALLFCIPPCHAEFLVLTTDAPLVVPGTKGGFDFIEVDAVGRHLLANHTRNGTFDIFDLDSGKLLKLCPTGAAQGVGVDEKGGKYYVGVSKEKKLVTNDAKTLEKIGEVALPGPADDALFNPKNDLVYAEGEKPYVQRLKPRASL